MKRIINYITIFLIGAYLASCNKDLGNYDYITPAEPVISNLDTVYEVLVGDTLRIKPSVDFGKPEQLAFYWKVSVPEIGGYLDFTGEELVMPFGLGAQRYRVRLAVEDKSTDMRYFYDFFIDGKTDFSRGIALLSVEDGHTLFSFIKPDGSIQKDLYGVLYGEALPGSPLSLNVTHGNYNPTDVRSYWIICGEGENPGVQLDINTMQLIKTFNENFYETPTGIQPQNLVVNMNGVLAGVMNNRLYQGASTTWDQFPIYGTFGVPSVGDYELSPVMIFSDASFGGDFNVGFERNRKQLVLFNAGAVYFGTNYDVNGVAFDPKKLDMEVISMLKVNLGANYAWARDANGLVQEVKFSTVSAGASSIVGPIHKRPFAGASYVREDSKWAASPAEIIYFTSGDKIYRYNPLNEEIRALSVDLQSKNISMMKLVDNGATLIVGVEGIVYYLDVSAGRNGNVIRTLTDLPGMPIDLFERN